jgi:hypothetical protein
VKVKITGATTAELLLDARSRGLADPSTFVELNDVVFATLDLAAAVDNSTTSTVAFSAVPATLTAAGVPAFGGNYPAGTVLDPVTFAWPVEQEPTPEPPAAPTVSVSKTSGLVVGEKVTVTGSGFVPDETGAPKGTRPPLSGKFGGVYVMVGSFAPEWKPSANAPTASRVSAPGQTKWAVPAADVATIGGAAAGAITLAADGSFSTELTVTNDFVGKLADGTLGVATYAGSGAKYAPFETLTPITFALVPTSTTLTTSAVSVAAGGAVSLAATVSPAVAGSVEFFNGAQSLGVVAVTAGGANLQVSGLAAGIATFRAVFTPTQKLLYSGSEGTVSVTVVAPVPATGSLTWGVKASFRDYIAGPIARGSITTSGVSTSGGAYVFPQAANGLNESGTGTASYSGSVRFYGHAGELDLTFRNPVVTLSSPTAGTLSVTVNGSQVAIASLNLGGGIRSTANGSVSYSAVPATLTGAGETAFSGFYSAGTALDPVSFVIGSNGSASGGTTTTAAFVGAKVPPATPPATTGVTVSSETELVEGGEITVTAEGFEPNETGIMIVIYSNPIVLARDLVADANGVVTWTGSLPAGMTGEHTLTVQGSVDRGVVLNIPAAEATVIEGCPVDDATLTWGFKESFRSYISGSIANGEWTVADGASYETPNFGWSDGTGGYDSETAEGLLQFTGSIAFTGHDGVLNTVVANPQIEFVDEGTAFLLLDVSGTTQDGAAVEQKAVRFVELALADAENVETGNAITLTGVPTELTADGAEAFGTYEAGSAFDPITVSFTTAECAETAAEVTPISGGTDDEPASNLGWLWWLIAALVLAAIIVVVIVLVNRRKATA